MRLQDKLLQLKSERKTILTTNFYNLETLSGILQIASLLKMPLILQLSESLIHYMDLSVATSLTKTALKEYAVEGWLHLDQGSSVIPDALLMESMRNTICKINLATETKNTFMLALKERLKNNNEIDLRIIFPDATQSVKNLIVKKRKLFI
jgi:fructose/tagatose bisphosphate aldolase